MADIFLSYASVDRERAQTLAHALERKGHAVWWDRTIPPGRVFDEVIQEALQAARCVVVLWSDQSVRSNWVKTEAGEGLAQGKLVPALLDAVPAPIEFKRIQAADLSGWTGDDDHPEYRKLLAAIDERLRHADEGTAPRAQAAPMHRSAAAPPKPKSAGLPILAIMGMLGVLGLAGAFALQWMQSRAPEPAAAPAPVPAPDAGKLEGNPAAAGTTGAGSAGGPPPATSTTGGSAPAGAAPSAPSAAVDGRVNLLAAENGGEVITASSERWAHTVDGKEETYAWTDTGEAVFGFKGGQAATFDTFAVLVPDTGDNNLKDFELLWSNEPGGGFKSIGKFSTQNLRIMKNPYQEFSFEPVRAKYLKVRSLKSHVASASAIAYEFRLYGTLSQ